MTEAILKRMSQDIHRQDNAHTAEPIFMVQEKKRIYGIDLDYSHTGTEFVDKDDPEANADEQTRREAYEVALKAGELELLVVTPYDRWRKHLDPRIAQTEEERRKDYDRYVRGEEREHFLDFCSSHYTEVGYLDIWVNVQPFFTKEGAEAYLKINGHNLKEPRIYVESAYRNYEWQAMRQMLLERGGELVWISVTTAMPPIDATDEMNAGLYRSANVLACDHTGKVYLAYLQYDIMGPPFEEPPRWKIAGSEEWDLGNTVTHWRPLPAAPKG